MTLPEINPIEISRWQGKVDANLTSLDVRMKNLEITVETLPERIEKRIEIMFVKNENSKITFKWVMENVALPIMMSGGSAGVAVYLIMKSIGG